MTMGFPGSSVGEEPVCNAGDHLQPGDLGLSLDLEDPLEKEMAAQSRILAWRIPIDREAWWGYSPWGRKESDMI